MLYENLKELRKAKGISQEELASQLHVVRQTISKWEKGFSVPDSEMLVRLAEVFDVTVSELLGMKIDVENNKSDIAEQLANINEQLAIKNRRSRKIWKIVGGVIIGIILFYAILLFLMTSVGVEQYEGNGIKDVEILEVEE